VEKDRQTDRRHLFDGLFSRTAILSFNEARDDVAAVAAAGPVTGLSDCGVCVKYYAQDFVTSSAVADMGDRLATIA